MPADPYRLIFIITIRCGKEATTFLKSLANQLSEKDGKPYSITRGGYSI